jgi:hypothetical protein
MRTVLVALLFLPAVALAQSGGGYDLSDNVIAGGGATFSTGGAYELGGTIGQADAGTLTGGVFAVHGGFWSVTGAPRPCFGDCNDSGTLTAGDIGRINQTILKCGPCAGGVPGGVAGGCAAVAAGCPAADFNDDGCLRASELGRANQNILKFQPSGCDPATP